MLNYTYTINCVINEIKESLGYDKEVASWEDWPNNCIHIKVKGRPNTVTFDMDDLNSYFSKRRMCDTDGDIIRKILKPKMYLLKTDIYIEEGVLVYE